MLGIGNKTCGLTSKNRYFVFLARSRNLGPEKHGILYPKSVFNKSLKAEGFQDEYDSYIFIQGAAPTVISWFTKFTSPINYRYIIDIMIYIYISTIKSTVIGVSFANSAKELWHLS